MSGSPHNLLLENTPFCKWISQPDPDKISPSSCQLSNDRFQLEEKLIFYEVLHEFCFDLSGWSQNFGLGTLLWGTQCPPQCLVEALGLGSDHHPRKKLCGSPTTSLVSRAGYIPGLELSLSHTPV